MPAGGGRGWTRRGGGGARRAVLRHYKLLIRAAEPQPKNVLEARRAKENSPGREPWVRIANLPAPARGERSTRLHFFRPVPGLACLSRRSQCSGTGLVSDAPPGLRLRQNRRALRRIGRGVIHGLHSTPLRPVAAGVGKSADAARRSACATFASPPM